MPITYTNLLLFFGSAFAALGLMWKLGVMPTRGFRLIWRRNNPDSFDAAMTIMLVVTAGLLAIALFGLWADQNSSRLMREAEQISGPRIR